MEKNTKKMKKMVVNSSSSTSFIHSSTKCVSLMKTSNNKGIDKKRKAKVQDGETTPAKRTSIYRGVTKHRLSGRFEAHLWDKNTWNNKKTKKGRQVYLGAYENEESAAHAYDLAALKYWGLATILNFPVGLYEREIKEMQNSTNEEYVAIIKRKSHGFSRGVSKYRGVAKHHVNGRWEARIGRIDEKKYMYLGTYASQEEAAVAYDKAAIMFRGNKAVTNFDISTYVDLLKQDHSLEDDTPPQTNDELQKDEQQNHNPDELGTGNEGINVLPQTQENLNNVDSLNDEMMDFANVCGNDIEQPWSPCLNLDELFDLNVFYDGPDEMAGESAPLFSDEPLYRTNDLNQDGIMDGDFMRYKEADQCYSLNKDITLDEYHTGDEANDLAIKEAKERKNDFFMLDDKGCNGHEASDLAKKQK